MQNVTSIYLEKDSEANDNVIYDRIESHNSDIKEKHGTWVKFFFQLIVW